MYPLELDSFHILSFQKVSEQSASEDTKNEVNAALELLEKLTKPHPLDVQGKGLLGG